MSSCGGGPLLGFGNGSMAFRGNKVVQITISPNNIAGLHFENGLTATNTPAEFARVLGIPPPSLSVQRLSWRTESGELSLEWMQYAKVGWQLGTLRLESSEIRDSK